jgi:hypothetical protein
LRQIDKAVVPSASAIAVKVPPTAGLCAVKRYMRHGSAAIVRSAALEAGFNQNDELR